MIPILLLFISPSVQCAFERYEFDLPEDENYLIISGSKPFGIDGMVENRIKAALSFGSIGFGFSFYLLRFADPEIEYIENAVLGAIIWSSGRLKLIAWAERREVKVQNASEREITPGLGVSVEIGRAHLKTIVDGHGFASAFQTYPINGAVFFLKAASSPRLRGEVGVKLKVGDWFKVIGGIDVSTWEIIVGTIVERGRVSVELLRRSHPSLPESFEMGVRIKVR